jgi:hypothetical protein
VLSARAGVNCVTVWHICKKWRVLPVLDKKSKGIMKLMLWNFIKVIQKIKFYKYYNYIDDY